VQAVSISTPPFLHYDMAVLQAGNIYYWKTHSSQGEARELYQLALPKSLHTILNFALSRMAATGKTVI